MDGAILRNASASAIFDLEYDKSRKFTRNSHDEIFLWFCLLFSFPDFDFAFLRCCSTTETTFTFSRSTARTNAIIFEHCAAVSPLSPWLGFDLAELSTVPLRHLYSRKLDHVVAFACLSTTHTSSAMEGLDWSHRHWVPTPFGFGLLDRNVGNQLIPCNFGNSLPVALPL